LEPIYSDSQSSKSSSFFKDYLNFNSFFGTKKREHEDEYQKHKKYKGDSMLEGKFGRGGKKKSKKTKSKKTKSKPKRHRKTRR
jgi:hypothetical protein